MPLWASLFTTCLAVDTNGWAAPQYVKEGDKVKTVNTWGKRDKDATGFAPAAPVNFMAHLSFTF